MLRLYRLRKKALMFLAALPMLQATGACDGSTIANFAASTALSLGAQLNVQLFSLFVSAVQQRLLQAFPSADILQILLGANRSPFF